MKRAIFFTAIIAGLAGFIAGNAFWYLASPLWIDRVVNESLPPELQVATLAAGEFSGADAVHKASGKATIYQSATGSKVLRLSQFNVTNGPDLKVWLVASDNISSSKDVSASRWHSLGPLHGNIGDQTYPIPDGLDLAEFGSVVIWCEQFSVLFALAPLKSTN